MVQWTDKRLLDKPDVIRSKFCLYLFQQTMVQVLYVRRNTGFRADEPVFAVLNVNRKPIYWSCGRQEKEMGQLRNVWIWNGNIMMKRSYGSYSIRIMNWILPVSGLCVHRKWIRVSLESIHPIYPILLYQKGFSWFCLSAKAFAYYSEKKFL